MKIPLSWLKDYIDIDLSLEELAKTLTMIGLEVEGIQLVGLALPPEDRHEFKYSGLSWDPEKIVVAAIHEVMPHPNADRLVLCRLEDGSGTEQIILTGAPNLFEFKGLGLLSRPIKVAYAKEGSQIYDGHQPGQVLTTLKRAKIRGVDSYSMVCSEKELGISDEHEGILLLPEDARVGLPLVDYMGDAIIEISILPNMIRNACVLGVARELSAVTGKELRKPSLEVIMDGDPIDGKVKIEITEPTLNPRFVLGLAQGIKIQPSPQIMQRRLLLAGMRPINNLVDATNYVMLELGQPLHAFDYDILVRRAKNKPPTIITHRAERGEVLTTLDGVERKLDEFTELVCDTAGSLSIAGVMGGMESEISDKTTSVLLEGASWNFINIRKTVASQKIPSEAAYRFSRGVHPTLAEQGVLRCLELIRQWSDGVVCKGLVDAYPQPVRAIPVEISVEDVKRILNIDLSLTEMASILAKLEFTCDVKGDRLSVLPPENRLDIGTGQVGKADLLEEIARIYHYDRIPERMPLDEIPPAASNPPMQMTEKIRDVLTQMGLQEVISYRLTSVEREARTIPYPEKWKPDYIRIVNPSTPDRCVMRRSILASILDCIEKNARQADSQQLFEIGSVYVPEPDQVLPAETRQLAIGLSGLRNPIAWDSKDRANFDFFDLKGFLEGLLTNLGIKEFRIRQEEHASYHPGKCAGVWVDDTQVGIFGEIHPLVRNHYEFGDTPVQAGVFDMEKLIQLSGNQSLLEPLPMYPPILEDLAVIIDETIPAETVVDVIRKAGGSVVKSIRLFDVFHGAQIGEGKKSLAYSLVYQSADRTLTDEDIRGTRNRIIKTLEQELMAKLRS